MGDVYAEFVDGFWRVVATDGRRYIPSCIGGFKQIGGHFDSRNGCTDFGWDESTRMPNEHTAQLVAGALQMWGNEVDARERSAEKRITAMNELRTNMMSLIAEMTRCETVVDISECIMSILARVGIKVESDGDYYSYMNAAARKLAADGVTYFDGHVPYERF